ncbi:delta-sarcoglycan-like isoform X2 [Penaeus japonicus]|uniref:delta-sarcoglycan-like isoform X2 n=1 Tax=Penaeus japonicus TaxID=27405 RepID=UPI001C714446|nr:delta-sarcoglycan-like isoform X2 [Penaeus japonicus]
MLKGVVQGYRPQVDWGGDSGSATIVVGKHNVRVATSGWRRRCLYTLLLALMALSVVNLSLTLWVLKTVYFNVEGMGSLHVVTGGVEMSGASDLGGKLAVGRILSRESEDLHINGYYNLTVFTAPENVSDSTFLTLGVDDVVAGAKALLIQDTDGHTLFETSPEGTAVGADTLTVTGNEGARFAGSVQTPLVYADNVHELRVESVTRGVRAVAAEEARVEARDGDISTTSLRDISLVAKQGLIRFDNPFISMPKLPVHGDEAITKEGLQKEEEEKEEEEGSGTTSASGTTTPTPPETQVPAPGAVPAPTTPLPPKTPPQQSGPVEVFQVCVCPNGKLFVVAVGYVCVSDEVVCR